MSAPNKKEASQIVAKDLNAIHFSVTISWPATSEITVTWTKADEEEAGNITWQAAVLAEGEDVGGLTLQAITLQ